MFGHLGSSCKGRVSLRRNRRQSGWHSSLRGEDIRVVNAEVFHRGGKEGRGCGHSSLRLGHELGGWWVGVKWPVHRDLSIPLSLW